MSKVFSALPVSVDGYITVEAVPAPGVTHLHDEVARNKERTHA
jgi:hypothetical protein